MADEANFPYLHGFSETEQERLRRQADFAEQSIYQDIDLSFQKRLLELGCGVGAQTSILLRRFPKLYITSVDNNPRQLETASKHLSKQGFAENRYELHEMNGSSLNFESNHFDSAFLCFVLEHVPEPKKILGEVRRVLTKGSIVYLTEVMNSSFFLEPYSPNTWRYWMAFNDFQLEKAGDPFVGAKLGNLLLSQGYQNIQTKVVNWHFDNRHPQRRREAIRFWKELLLSAADHLISEGIVTDEVVQGMKKELKNVESDPEAVFFYAFIQAKAEVG